MSIAEALAMLADRAGTDDSARKLLAATVEVDQAPRSVVEHLASRRLDPFKLNAAANCASFNTELRREGATSVFITLILRGYEKPSAKPMEDPAVLASCHWEQPLQGLSNIIGAIYNDSDEELPEDEPLINEIRTAYQSIVRVIWRDVHHLLAPGDGADCRRAGLCSFILRCAAGLDMREAMLDDPYTLPLAMLCYINQPLKQEQMRAAATTMIQSLIPLLDEYGNATGPEYWPSLDKAVRSVTSEVLAAKFELWLSNADLLNDHLVQELMTIMTLTIRVRPYVRKLAKMGLYKDIIAAVRRQKAYGQEEWTKQAIKSAADLMIAFSVKKDDMQMDEYLRLSIDMVKSGALEISLEGMCVNAEEGADALSMFLERIIHCIVGGADAPKELQALRELLTTACCNTMRQIYLPTSVRLKRAGSTRPLAVLGEFKDFLQLNENELSPVPGVHPRRTCGNARCSRRTDRNGQLLRCARCRAAYYCSAECQQQDWTEHRPRCRAAQQERAANILQELD